MKSFILASNWSASTVICNNVTDVVLYTVSNVQPWMPNVTNADTPFCQDVSYSSDYSMVFKQMKVARCQLTFQGVIQKNQDTMKWQITLNLNNQQLKFMIDTGAHCNVIAKDIHPQLSKVPLHSPQPTI